MAVDREHIADLLIQPDPDRPDLTSMTVRGDNLVVRPENLIIIPNAWQQIVEAMQTALPNLDQEADIVFSVADDYPNKHPGFGPMLTRIPHKIIYATETSRTGMWGATLGNVTNQEIIRRCLILASVLKPDSKIPMVVEKIKRLNVLSKIAVVVDFMDPTVKEKLSDIEIVSLTDVPTIISRPLFQQRFSL